MEQERGKSIYEKPECWCIPMSMPTLLGGTPIRNGVTLNNDERDSYSDPVYNGDADDGFSEGLPGSGSSSARQHLFLWEDE